jgi:polyhydroxybutyrate depolymerase
MSARIEEAFRRTVETTLLILSVGCGVSLAHADEVLTFSHQGIARTATMHTPAGLPAGPAPLVIGLHGRGQPIAGLREWLHLDATADREHFVVVYAEAVDLEWNYGRPIVKPMPVANDEPVDDVGFIRLIIDKLVESKRADPARIYVAGVSRGGLMAYTLACVLADQIAAVAATINSMTEYQREDCRPARPVPLMVIAGTNDRVQMYDGWLFPLGRLTSVPETLEFWRLQNGCAKQDGRDIRHREPSDTTRIWLFRWTDCRDGVRLQLYRVNGGGHQVPTFTPNSEKEAKNFGFRNRDIEAADEIWSFFKEFAR